MQAITTKYHPATNTRGSRVSATAEAGKVILHWDDSLDVEENHDAAAMAMCLKFGWTGKLAVGALPNVHGGNVYVFVTHYFRRVGKLRVVR